MSLTALARPRSSGLSLRDTLSPSPPRLQLETIVKALILAGGSGTRFWPASRRSSPKQLLRLVGESSLLQRTVRRLAPEIGPQDCWISTTSSLRRAVRDQLPELPPERFLAEPAGRNTLPAIAWSVSMLPSVARDDVIVVLPSDHWVADETAFRRSLDEAAAAARRDEVVVTLGVRPRHPETGYGYLELAAPPAVGGGAQRVRRFVEKPDLETARRFLADGRYLWNAGIFLFRGATLLRLLERVRPDVAVALAELGEASPEELAAGYRQLRAESIDAGLMERLDDILTLPLDCGWSDLGSWAALAEVLAGDAVGNRRLGDLVAVEAGGNVVYSDRGTVALLGVDGLVVVRSGDAVLVMPKERAQDVRLVVQSLEGGGRVELL
jgi:mannose-1-phosphate guanylyltransferase/mannose-6-phosphate isomerase